MVKDELGRDAVILHTKRYKQGGFFGIQSKEVVEVTAAVDDVPRRPRVKLPAMPKTPRPAPQPAVPEEPQQPQIAARPRNVLSQYKTAGTEEGVSIARSQNLAADRQSAGEDFTPLAPEPLLRPASTTQPVRRQPKPRQARMAAPPLRVRPESEKQPGSVRPNIEELQPALAEPILPRIEPEPIMDTEPAPRRAALRNADTAVPGNEKSRIIKAETLAMQSAGEESTPAEAMALVPKAQSAKAELAAAEKMVPAPKASAEIREETGEEAGAQPNKNQEKIHALEDELAQMRQMLRQVMNQSADGEDVKTLKDALKFQELRDDVMQDIIRKIPPATMMLEKNSSEAVKALGDYLHSVLKTGNGIGLKAGRPKIVALIGTTGVGKTTTVAKIAAKFVLEKGVREIALIAADNYRIAAVEQLKTYSDILGLPLEVVFTTADLKAKLRQHRDKKLILIDTAGRSQNNEEQMGELKDFLATEPSIEKHLVLSATTKERDAEAIFERFAACRPDRILLTKTDETENVGFIVNLLFDRRLALSYLTTGQTVPDDIEPAQPEALAKLMLR